MRQQKGVSITAKRLAGTHTVLVQEGASVSLSKVLRTILRSNCAKVTAPNPIAEKPGQTAAPDG
jgi:hypothetical protein